MIYNAKSDIGGTISPFNYRKKLTINHSGALSSYQLKFTVNQVNTMKIDFGDIRFNTDTGNYIPYWIESITGTSPNQTATVWVKADFTNGDTIIYMYYGNESLLSASNGDNTFLFFDDFSNDLSKWTIATGTVDIYNGMLRVRGGATYPEVWHEIDHTTGILDVKTYVGQTASDDEYIGICGRNTNGTPNVTGDCCGVFMARNSYAYRAYNGSVWATSTGSWTDIQAATWYSQSLIFNSTSVVWKADIGNSATTQRSSFTTSKTGIKIALIGYFSNDINKYGYFDNVRLRKYTATEPTYLTSTEQTITAKSMSITPRESPCRVGICVIDISVTWTNTGEGVTFTPSIIVDSTTHSLSPIVLPNGDTPVAFVVSGLSVGNHTVCPDPN